MRFSDGGSRTIVLHYYPSIFSYFLAAGCWSGETATRVEQAPFKPRTQWDEARWRAMFKSPYIKSMNTAAILANASHKLGSAFVSKIYQARVVPVRLSIFLAWYLESRF